MPDSNSPYVTVGAPLLDMLKGQFISATEDRRRVMLWSAILALGSLMLLGKVASVPWFLALVPLVLLAIWNACLLVRQRRCQAVWDGLMEKAGEAKSSSATKAAAAAISAPENEAANGAHRVTIARLQVQTPNRLLATHGPAFAGSAFSYHQNTSTHGPPTSSAVLVNRSPSPSRHLSVRACFHETS